MRQYHCRGSPREMPHMWCATQQIQAGGVRLLIYLTPCIPLSFEGEGEESLRGAKPLLNTLFYPEVRRVKERFHLSQYKKSLSPYQGERD